MNSQENIVSDKIELNKRSGMSGNFIGEIQQRETKNGVELQQILKICDQYMKNIEIQETPNGIRTLGDIELETKINIESLDEVESILNNLTNIGVYEVAHRTEQHHFFSKNLIAHNVLILIKDSNEVWIKVKKDRQEVFTPNNIPLLSRHEIKMRPQDINYQNEFQKTISQNYIGSFKKECLDFSFCYKDLLFTTTFSLADSENSSLYQIEFEFEEHREKVEPPSFKTILTTFDQMLLDTCGNKTNRLNTHTKLEWLLSNNNKH